MIIAYSGKKTVGKDTCGRITQILLNSPHLNNEGIMTFLRKNVGDNSSWQIKKFADKLKDIVCLLINCTREQLEDEKFKEKELGEEWWYYKWKALTVIKIIDRDSYNNLSKNQKQYWDLIKLTPRLLLQLLGTECGRQIIHPNLWINALMSEYKLIKDTKVSEFLKAEGLPETMNGGKEYYPNWIITDMRFTNELKAVKDKGGITIRVNRSLPCTDELKEEHESETALDNAEFDYVIDNNGSIEELIEKVKEILTKEELI